MGDHKRMLGNQAFPQPASRFHKIDLDKMEESTIHVSVWKGDLIRDLRQLRSLSEEYGILLRRETVGEGWENDVLALLRDHHMALVKARLSLKTIDLVSAILREMLRRLRTENFTLRVAKDSEVAFSPDEGLVDGELIERLMSQINILARNVPLAMQEKIRFLLVGIKNLFYSLQTGEVPDLENAVSQINLLTSSRESQNLVREIALIARDIYNTLNALSEDVSIEVISESTDGISDAVLKLKSVVDKLEEAAIKNLDQLELLGEKVREDEETCDRLLGGLRSSQQVLGELKLQFSEQGDTLGELQDMLGDTIGADVMSLKNRAAEHADMLLSLIGNQSFQDLTGQTLKRTIHFIEGLEVQLVLLLQKYRPVFGLGTVQKPSQVEGKGEELDRPQSQVEVDSILADLGF